jgi:hypothetical protein
MNAFRFFLLLLAATFVLSGCVTAESENVAERPWNAQQGWQHGLPSSINQGR